MLNIFKKVKDETENMTVTIFEEIDKGVEYPRSDKNL